LRAGPEKALHRAARSGRGGERPLLFHPVAVKMPEPDPVTPEGRHGVFLGNFTVSLALFEV
jgi:hypothetical protein